MEIKRGDIFLLDIQNSIRDGAKLRPVVVIDKNPDRDCDTIVLLISSQGKRDKYDMPIKGWKKAGLVKDSVARPRRMIHIGKSVLKNSKKLGSLQKEDLYNLLEYYDQMVDQEISNRNRNKNKNQDVLEFIPGVTKWPDWIKLIP